MLAKGFKTSMYGPVSYSQLSLISMTKDSFLQGRLDVKYSIKFQCGYDLFTTLSIVCDSDLVGIYVESTPSRG